MAEKKEIRVEKKEESKIKKAWNKIKKPLATGILAGGLLLSPVQKAESVGFDYARPPPYYASELIEKDKDINVRLGWMAIKKIKQIAEAKRPVSEQKPYFDMAVNYFKRAYEKNKTPENFYLYCHTLYQSIQLEPTYESTEEKELEVIKLIEERLKEQPNDMDFIDLKQIIYYNLAIMYYRAAVNFNDVRGPPSLDEKEAYNPSKREFYKKKAIEYIKNWLKYNKWMKEHWNEFEFFAWLSLYEEDAKIDNISLKEQFEQSKMSFKKENEKREEELKDLLKKLE
jgi:tetratricopeptide (TPR) repeat protein